MEDLKSIVCIPCHSGMLSGTSLLLAMGNDNFFNVVSQLICDSLKAKQLQIFLHAEKQELNVRIQHANISADKYKQRIARLEEQVSH